MQVNSLHPNESRKPVPLSANVPGPSATYVGRETLPTTFDQLRPSIVAFASKFAVTGPGQVPAFPLVIGTGFVVDSRGIVVTNRHIVEALEHLPRHPVTGARSDMAIVWANVEQVGSGHVLPVLFVDVKATSLITSFSTAEPFFGEPLPDISFVQLNVRDLPAARLETEPNSLRIGLPVATAGFPHGTHPMVAYGKVTQLTPILRHGVISSLYPFPCPNPHGFTIDVASAGGASGSPVFAQEEPKILGMVHAGFPNSDITIAIPASLIGEAVNQGVAGASIELSDVPTLKELLEKSERSSDLKWDSFGQAGKVR